MPDYRFRGKELEELTREELIEALRQALDLLHQRSGGEDPIEAIGRSIRDQIRWQEGKTPS